MTAIDVVRLRDTRPLRPPSAAHRIVIADAPARRGSRRHLAHNIQVALGWHARSTQGLTDADVIANLYATRRSQLIIDDASRLAPQSLQWARDIALASNTQLTLVARRPLSPQAQRWLQNHPHHRRRTVQYRPGPSRPKPPPAVNRFPSVPDCDWPWFRSHATAHAPEPDRARFDTTYLAHLTLTRDVCQLPHLGPDKIAGHLRRQLVGVDDADHALTIIRATQAAAFEAGWNLRADPATIRKRYDQHASPTPARPTDAILVSANAHAISIAEVISARVADTLPPDLPSHAIQVADAVRVARRLNGADEDDPLLITTRQQPMTARHAAEILRRHQGTLALRTQPHRWPKVGGVHITRLTSA